MVEEILYKIKKRIQYKMKYQMVEEYQNGAVNKKEAKDPVGFIKVEEKKSAIELRCSRDRV